jgi:uncharacterized protein
MQVDETVLELKREALRVQLREAAPLIVAYSGGVDSAFLLAEAACVLGDGVTGVIADSPSLVGCVGFSACVRGCGGGGVNA